MSVVLGCCDLFFVPIYDELGFARSETLDLQQIIGQMGAVRFFRIWKLRDKAQAAPVSQRAHAPRGALLIAPSGRGLQ